MLPMTSILIKDGEHVTARAIVASAFRATMTIRFHKGLDVVGWREGQSIDDFAGVSATRNFADYSKRNASGPNQKAHRCISSLVLRPFLATVQ